MPRGRPSCYEGGTDTKDISYKVSDLLIPQEGGHLLVDVIMVIVLTTELERR